MKGKGKVLPLLAILLLTALFAAAGLAEQAEQATLTEPAELAEQTEKEELAEWTVMFYIPVRLGTEKYLLRCGMNLVTQELTIFGLWEGYESDSRAFGRNTMHLSQMAGREYSLLYSIDGTKQYEASDPMTMYRALEIKAEPLPAGDYFLEYWVESTFSRRLEVGRAALHWDGEKVSVPPEASWEGVMDLNL